ncbi:MAG TPA: CHAD domain-containing protein [Solirubrobacteraceae bacterium]|nr:CHAD domain-containing protein [Solirubrobacteraceae bacterium]
MIREYLADEGFRLDGVEAALDGLLRLGPVRTHTRELTFYDTFDALLREAGMTVAVSDPDEIPAAARELAGVRALLPLARVSVTTQTAALLDELDKTVVRLELLTPRGLAPRIRLEGLRGYEDELARVEAALGLEAPAPECLRDEAVRAAGGHPRGVSAKVTVALAPETRADAAIVAVLGALWTVVEANWEGTVDDLDAEFLHDLRVCVRKTRAVLKEFPGVLPPALRALWRAELKWLQLITGDTRDLDVMLEDFTALAGLLDGGALEALEPLRRVLIQRRATARRLMVRDLRGERAQTLRTGWPELLGALERLPGDDRPDASGTIGALAGERILTVHRRMVKMGRALEPDSPAEDYHELRKQGKELRYLLELFGMPLHDATVVKPMVKALKELQDVLGRHQDREVQALTLRRLSGAVAAVPDGPDALLAMGALVQALGADERAARREFGDVFRAFASAEQRALARRTFRS